MGKIITVANQKGGVGKTTTAINLSTSLAVMAYKTLVIDADPQANTTSGLGIDPAKVKHSIYDCMVDEVPVEEIIQKTTIDFLDILPANIHLVGAEVEMVPMENREKKMKYLLRSLPELYDYIIIDCSPSLGLVTVNALTAAHTALIPVQCEYFALEGLGKLLNTIKIIQAQLNINLSIEGILLTMYDARLCLANQVVHDIKNHFQHMVFETIIPRNVKLSESPSFGLPTILHDSQSKGAMSYMHLAREIVKNNQHIISRKNIEG